MEATTNHRAAQLEPRLAVAMVLPIERADMIARAQRDRGHDLSDDSAAGH
ncbi:hypothetical protein [Lipingzhangella rawalii]|nr:hypothetical protein [Lipingzhangella rawalii]